MKNRRNFIVKIEELPFRTENLGNSLLLKIYGGECIDYGNVCDPSCNNNCCSDLICDYNLVFICDFP
jgi:hypothetical protein